MKPPAEKITLIGAGLNGPLLAILLIQRGFAVEIYERRSDMRRVRMSAGRSINLALSTRGIHGLQQAGLWERMRTIIIPMKGRMMHSVAGELTFQPYGKNETEVINSISRAELNIALMNAAEEQGATIHFNERCTGYDLRTGAIRLRNEATGKETIRETRVTIGCDGSASSIRTEMLKLSRFNFSQQYLDYGYKELTIPAGPKGEHLLETQALHIWPRGNHMLIALPNIDGTFACILFLPFEGADSFASLTTPADVMRLFQARFPDAVPLMPDLGDNYFTNPTGAMVTVKCSPWHLDGKALLLGDAAHAIVPFFGQGINCGFEDCTSLMELLDRFGADWPRVFADFEHARKVNTDAIADMAVENFTEMRDRVADSRFLLRKKVELALEAKYPQLFVPKYAMVTFHRIPYSVALARGALQDRMLAELCESINSVEDLDWEKADRLIRRDLAPLEIQ
ncbi:MAG TPA: NAD(P)/FAD-dependent oxidoreductase [Candidatus Dormibacteraeota bacterium]|jgi:kynurenine 3-monooxygenase|nr:NAD(P)/FAD-dependent oxidoreductase [Candidatus Dormibacteraeota bacterium]